MWLVAGSGHWSTNSLHGSLRRILVPHTDNSKFRNGGYLEWGAKLEGFDKAGVVRCAAKTNGVRTQPSARANQVDMKGGSARKLSCKR